MQLTQIRTQGLEALDLTTRLLQRYRMQSATGGIWESADFHWNWRVPRTSDHTDQLFLLDQSGPVAGILLTSNTNNEWQVDPISVPGFGPCSESLWQLTQNEIHRIDSTSIEVPVRDDDDDMSRIVRENGWQPSENDRTAWMNEEDRPEVIATPAGFVLTDRTQLKSEPHHLSSRNGAAVEERLKQSTLYDPTLDLVMQSETGEVAGYALFWFDPATKVGLVEPVRTEDAWQRKGIARSLVTNGVDKLFSRGAARVKVSNESEAAARLYDKVGFVAESTTTWFRKAFD